MKVAVIGGTGLASLGALSPAVASTQTPYGPASAAPRRLTDFPHAVFLNRHGDDQGLLPHAINYRANLWLLRELAVDAVVAVFAVGGIEPKLANGDLALPRQLIDYTWGRAHTFRAGHAGSADPPAPLPISGEQLHADFSEPFDAALRERLGTAARRAGIAVHDGGVYGCAQGPRLETAAEIDRMERDGCTLVGMTAMPEAALARELGLPYAGICMIVNPAAGRGAAILEVSDMLSVVDAAQPRLLSLLVEFLNGVDQL